MTGSAAQRGHRRPRCRRQSGARQAPTGGAPALQGAWRRGRAPSPTTSSTSASSTPAAADLFANVRGVPVPGLKRATTCDEYHSRGEAYCADSPCSLLVAGLEWSPMGLQRKPYVWAAANAACRQRLRAAPRRLPPGRARQSGHPRPRRRRLTPRRRACDALAVASERKMRRGKKSDRYKSIKYSNGPNP